MAPLINHTIKGVFQYATDLEQASRWYCDNLGFTLGPHDFANYAELLIEGRYVMHLLKSDTVVPARDAAFSFDTDDIDGAYQALRDKGAEVDSLQVYSDHRSFTFRDGEGNALMISQFDTCKPSIRNASSIFFVSDRKRTLNYLRS